MVTITDATPGVTIYYTTDGTNPSKSSPIYLSGHPITVSSTTIIKAIAIGPGYPVCPEGAAKYIFVP